MEPVLRQRRTMWMFVALAVYIVLQSAWWAWLLVNKDRELEQLITAFELRPEQAGVAEVHVSRTFWMVAGEGVVVVALLLVALWIIYRIVREELRTARRQHDLMIAVSHELRTPVAGMKLHLQTLARPDLDPTERAQLHQRALADVQRLHELTERVLLAARLDEGVVQLAPVVQDLRTIADDVVRRMSASVPHLIQVGGEPVMARVDPGALASILGNLLENAMKYGPPKGIVDVETGSGADGAYIRVLDRGPGVAPADRARIFEKFHRGGQAMEQQVQGTGLGLYIADRLARRMGGVITVTDRPGGGAIFAATFPRS